jgi:hypothetical protein
MLVGSGGNNYMDGGAGTDRLDYSAAPAGVTVNLTTSSALNGYAGTDTLANIENVNGSAFNDAIAGSDGVANVLNGLGGINTVSYYLSTQGVAINLVTGTAIDGGGVTDTLLNFNNANGSGFNDTFVGVDGVANVLNGLDGINTISYAGASSGVRVDLYSQIGWDASSTDTLLNFQNVVGSQFNDAISASNAANVLDGLGGVNIVSYYKNSSGVTIDLSSGTAVDATGVVDTLLNFQNVNGSSHNDTIGGSSVANTLNGLGGTNTVTYANHAVAVTVNLVSGNAVGTDGIVDTLLNFQNANGSSHNDTIIASSVANVLNGLGGINTISYAGASSGVRVDLYSQIGWDASSTDTLLNFQNVVGSQFNDAISATNAANVLNGLGGVNMVSYYKNSSGVTIDLSNGTAVGANGVVDTLLNFQNVNGSSHNDTIGGSSVANTLNGLGGIDQLTGLGGNDTFVFNRGQAGGDTITDFAGNGAAAGDQLQFVGFGAGATFTNIDATHWQISYNNGANYEIVTFTNGAAIHSSDFIFL